MQARDKELWEEAAKATKGESWDEQVAFMQRFANLIRADERDTFIAFIQDYPHWLGDNAKREIISAIRARGNT